MSKDKFHDEDIARSGYMAGKNNQPKSSNPYRDKNNEDEKRWDANWERAQSGKDFDAYE